MTLPPSFSLNKNYEPLKLVNVIGSHYYYCATFEAGPKKVNNRRRKFYSRSFVLFPDNGANSENIENGTWKIYWRSYLVMRFLILPLIVFAEYFLAHLCIQLLLSIHLAEQIICRNYFQEERLHLTSSRQCDKNRHCESAHFWKHFKRCIFFITHSSAFCTHVN